MNSGIVLHWNPGCQRGQSEGRLQSVFEHDDVWKVSVTHGRSRMPVLMFACTNGTEVRGHPERINPSGGVTPWSCVSIRACGGGGEKRLEENGDRMLSSIFSL